MIERKTQNSRNVLSADFCATHVGTSRTPMNSIHLEIFDMASCGLTDAAPIPTGSNTPSGKNLSTSLMRKDLSQRIGVPSLDSGAHANPPCGPGHVRDNRPC